MAENKNTSNNKPANRWQALKRQVMVQAGLVLAIVLVVNVVAGLFHKRIDLTEDNRYTVSEPTVKLLESLNDDVFVKVYLEGKDLPAGIRRLSDATREMLDEFRVIAGDHVQYEFVNPDDLPNQQARNDLYQQLAQQGLTPTELQVNAEDKFTTKVIVPGAMLTYADKSVPATLMQPQRGDVSPEEELNSSMAQLEYQLASAIRKLQAGKKHKIAILQGHGELKPIYVADFVKSLRETYDVDFVNLPQYKIGRLDPYDAVVIAKPDSVFTELEKYKIDQYIVKGGKVLWLMDNLMAEMDSLKGGSAFTANMPMNTEDMLFKYGLRLNYNLVQDLNCHFIPLMAGGMGQQKGQLLKWPYFPVVTPTSDHPIVNSLNAIWFQFANTIDTLPAKQNPNVHKTVLLTSSFSSRVAQHPVQINLNMVRSIDPRFFQSGPQNLAVLVEGRFRSAFANRIQPGMDTAQYGVFKAEDKPGKLILISDGDVIKNQVSLARQQFFPLGFDRYTNQTFGNKTFLLNSIDYLVEGGEGLISLRAKQFRLRLLDAGKVKTDKLDYQILNTVVPIGVVLVFGVVYNYVRRRRYA